MTTIRNDGPRSTDVRTAKPQTLKPGAAEGIKKPTVIIAGSDSVGGSAIEKSAQNIAAPEVAGQALGQSASAEEVSKTFGALGEKFLNVALTGNPAARFSLEGRSPTRVLDQQAGAALDQLVADADTSKKSDLKTLKSDVAIAGANVFLKKNEAAQTSALATAVLSDPKARPEAEKLGMMMSAMVAMPKSSKAGGPPVAMSTEQTLQAEKLYQSTLTLPANADIESLVAIMMFLISKDAETDVREMLDDMKKINTQKKAKREQIHQAKESLAEINQIATNAEDAADGAKANEATAQKAAEDAQTALTALKNATDPNAVATAQAGVNDAATRKALADQIAANAATAVAAASAIQNGVTGSAGRFDAQMQPPPVNAWASNLNLLGLRLGTLGSPDFNQLVTTWNKIHPDQKITSLDQLMTKLGCKLILDNSGVINRDNVQYNVEKLMYFAQDALTYESAHGVSATGRSVYDYLRMELITQTNTLKKMKTDGVPYELARMGAMAEQIPDPLGSQVRAAYQQAITPPLSPEKTIAAVNQIYAFADAASKVTTGSGAHPVNIRMANDLKKCAQDFPKDWPSAVTSNETLARRYGLTGDQIAAMQATFDALPTELRNGKSNMWEWAMQAPGLVPLESGTDRAHANANRQALKGFLQSEATRATSAAAANKSEKEAGVSSAGAAVDTANAALTDAQKDAQAVLDAQAHVETAKAAAEQSKDLTLQAKLNASEKRKFADAAKNQVDKMQDDMDSLGEMNSENQTRMQMFMDRMQKSQTMLSNLLSSFAKTKDAIIQNMK